MVTCLWEEDNHGQVGVEGGHSLKLSRGRGQPEHCSCDGPIGGENGQEMSDLVTPLVSVRAQGLSGLVVSEEWGRRWEAQSRWALSRICRMECTRDFTWHKEGDGSGSDRGQKSWWPGDSYQLLPRQRGSTSGSGI